ncbi:MAG: class I SAM-dependent methyltransferase [archaeon]
MNRTFDKKVLVESHYKTDEKLVLRQKYNQFAKPKTDHGPTIIKKILSLKTNRILDVGCGHGDLLIELRKSGFGGELIGLDLSEGIQEKGKAKNKREKLNIDFVVGDAENLPFQNNTFDVILAKHMLYHLPNPQKGVEEIYRCLKKEGTLIITLNSKNNTPLLHEIEHKICKKYDLTSEHNQDIVNMETADKYLTKFSNIKKEYKEGKINKPEMFPAIFESFRDNYEPQPDDALWNKIMANVKEFVKEKSEANGIFTETRISGIITAQKN